MTEERNDPELPDELRTTPRDEAAQELELLQRLSSIGMLIAKKRDDAIKARKQSGIEDIWDECEDNYAGIDSVNRGTGGSRWRKPTSPTGPLTKGIGKEADNRSTVFVRLTTRYVDMGAAKVKEKALPIDDKPFKAEPTPTPDLVSSGAASQQPPQAPQQPTPPMPGAQPGAGAQPPSALTPVADAAAQATKVANEAAEKSSDRIYGWMTDADYSTHIRRVIDDGARLGVGILKGPFPDVMSSRSFSVITENGQQVGALEIEQKTFPGCSSVDPWNFFPAANCGEDIHEGDYVFERAWMSEAKLNDLKKLAGLPTEDCPQGEPIYLSDQIDKVIKEGPEQINLKAERDALSQDKKGLYALWHYTGQMSRDDMSALGAVGVDELPDEIVTCNAIVTMVNDTVIRAQFNPLTKSGNFPYRVFCWSRRAGFWAGVGVAEQVMVPQNMVNAATRAWLNNAGVSSGVQLIIDTSKLTPLDNNFTIGGGIKLWSTTAEGQGEDVRRLMSAVEIPNRGEELKTIIDYAFKLAEEMSNIPLISQGQNGPDDPQTFGQAELQNNNAHTLLRQIADNLDSYVVEPLVRDYYEWLLLDPDVPIEEKGDFHIVAKGSSAMVERAIQEQFLMNLLNIAPNPAYGLSPARTMEGVIRAKRMDPVHVQLTDEEKQRMAANPPPPPPQVQAAQINAQSRLQGIQMENQTRLQEVQMEAQHEQQLLLNGGTTPHMAMAQARIEQERIRATTAETVEASRAYAEEQRANKEMQIAWQNGQFEIQKMQLQRDLAILQYAHQNNMKLTEVKAELANTALQEQTKRQLAAAEIELAHSEGDKDRLLDLHKHHTPSLVRDRMTTPVTP